MHMEPVLLYSVPPSFYSQIARLVLAEKGVAWRTRMIAAGPPIFESYRPWYMKLNPGGTVPTLVHNGDVVADSYLIAEYAERTFDGPPLFPEDPGERAEMERWVASYRGISLRELSYGSGKMKRIGAFVNRLRVRRLHALADRHPELAGIYRAKERDIQGFADHAVDDAHVAGLNRLLTGLFDELDKVLADRPWIAGENYSLADVVWTVTVARLLAMGDTRPLDGRPALSRWFEAARRRPSYDKADVWDHFKPAAIIRIMAGKLWPQLTGLLLAVTALGAGLWWWLAP